MIFKQFFPGEKVFLVNDPKKQEFEIVEKKMFHGLPDISKGPMRQFSPDWSYLCKSPMEGYEGEYWDYWYFRSDALERKDSIWRYIKNKLKQICQ